MTNTTRSLSALVVLAVTPLVFAADQGMEPGMKQPARSAHAYVDIGGLRMYYEIHGQPRGEKVPLVLLHGGGSTIETTFGRILPILATNRQLIAPELQAHGHTADIDRPLSFEQDADDVAALLRHLDIRKADVLGFSNGGSTAMQLAIRHPQMVRKLVVASSFYRNDGLYPAIRESFKAPPDVASMPDVLQQAYLGSAPDPENLPVLVDKLMQRLRTFEDWPASDLEDITAPVLVMQGDADIARPEHAVEMASLLPHGRLVILPGGHGDYLGEVTTAADDRMIAHTAALIDAFLEEGFE